MATAKRPQLTGLREWSDGFYKRTIRVIQLELAPEAKRSLDRLLLENRQANTKPMPEKLEATKKAYKRKGYNTENFLVRTGASTRILIKRVKTGATLRPAKPEILQYHDVNAGGSFPTQRVDWFRLNFGTRQKLLRLLREFMFNAYPRTDRGLGR